MARNNGKPDPDADVQPDADAKAKADADAKAKADADAKAKADADAKAKADADAKAEADAARPAKPPPAAIKPPGKVLYPNVHGLAHAPPSPGPIERLRAALCLSGNVPEFTVLHEAATRLEQLLSGQPVTFPSDDGF